MPLFIYIYCFMAISHAAPKMPHKKFMISFRDIIVVMV